jgi:hypothetical protein
MHLYIRTPTRLIGVVLNLLSTGTTLPLPCKISCRLANIRRLVEKQKYIKLKLNYIIITIINY